MIYQAESLRAAGRVEHRTRLVNTNHAILPEIVDCIRQAAGADGVQEISPGVSPAVTDKTASTPSSGGISYIDRLGLPVLGIGLSAGLLFGVAVPGVVIGGVILAAAIPIFKRTVQGIREEKRLPVELLDASALVLLTAQASFLAPAIVGRYHRRVGNLA